MPAVGLGGGTHLLDGIAKAVVIDDVAIVLAGGAPGGLFGITRPRRRVFAPEVIVIGRNLDAVGAPDFREPPLVVIGVPFAAQGRICFLGKAHHVFPLVGGYHRGAVVLS